MSAVPGKQTVPRAELYALLFLLQHTTGDLLIFSDWKSVVKGFNRPRWKTITSDNCDLWSDIWTICDQRADRIVLRKLKAHATEQHLASGLISPIAFVGNHLADTAARLGADAHEISATLADPLGWIDQATWLIQKRLIAVISLSLSHHVARSE